jgi:hypothetical protein
LKADLHIHSTYSKDSIAKPETILAAAADHGIDIIGITDHNTSMGWHVMTEMSKKFPVKVVLGQEMDIYHNNELLGQVLCLFLNHPIKGHDLNSIITQVQNQDALISISHPFSENQTEFKAFDFIQNWTDIAIEVRNGRTYNSHENQMADSLAKQLGTLITAGSDAHTPFEVGNVFMEFEGQTVDDLKNAIRHKDIQINGKPSSILFSLLSYLGKIGITM